MIELVNYHTMHKVKGGHESALRSAFVKAGTKWLQVVALDATSTGGLRVWKAPLSDKQYMKPLMKGRTPYPVKRALNIFRKIGRTHGITKGAKKLLREASEQHKQTKETSDVLS